MTPKDILVVQCPDRGGAVMTVAGQLACRFGARLHGLCVYAAPAPTAAESFAIGADAAGTVIERMEQQAESLTAIARADFDAKIAACEVEGIWTQCFYHEAVYQAPWDARRADLVILPRPLAHQAESLSLTDAILLQGGAPCLIVPETVSPHAPFDRIVVAWNDTPAAKRAMDHALPFLQEARAVQILAIAKHAHAADQKHDRGLLDHLSRQGVTAEICHVDAGDKVAKTMIAACASFEADLIVMGAYGHNRRAEALFGRVTRHVLAHATLPLLMAS
jgi:nucleotide-binding universal stress UspA family protein